jgi:hypothetical protein
VQASYLPKGVLGDVHRHLSTKLGLYNQHEASLPQSYGVTAMSYTTLKYNSKRKIELLTTDGFYWNVIANGTRGWPIFDLCTPTQYYFLMPSDESSEIGAKENKKVRDLSQVQQLKPYTVFWLKNLAVGGGENIVLMSKNNRFPFIKITRGEYLKQLESAVPRRYEKEKKEIYEHNKNDQRSIDYFMKYLDDKNAKRVACLKKNTETYKNRLNETAQVYTNQPDAMLENVEDVFEGSGGSANKFVIYKVDPEMAELCKKDQPQWIMMSWDWSPNDPAEKNMHESIINNFNFEYVYNFFFAPEKVKGQAYKPLRSPFIKEAVVVAEASQAQKQNSADKNVFFFEDFSTTGKGTKPIGWRATLSPQGTTATVTTPDGLKGNWVELKGHYMSAAVLKAPLPQNFTLTYDLVASEHFAWGSKGLSMRLAKETSPQNAESYLLLRIRPGFDGRDGEAMLETKFPSPPGYLNVSKWYAASGFSNNKKVNRIAVTIKKSGETLQIFIDKNKIAEFEKAIPAAHLFNALSFDSGGNSAETDKYYISNIKITKD